MIEVLQYIMEILNIAVGRCDYVLVSGTTTDTKLYFGLGSSVGGSEVEVAFFPVARGASVSMDFWDS